MCHHNIFKLNVNQNFFLELQALLNEISYNVLKNQPANIEDFIASFLNKKITQRQAREESKLDLTFDDLWYSICI